MRLVWQPIQLTEYARAIDTSYIVGAYVAVCGPDCEKNPDGVRVGSVQIKKKRVE